MWIRSLPPTCASNSQTGLVKPSGPHHCAKCCGSVQALNTSARGASNTRVIVTSRSARGFVWTATVMHVSRWCEINFARRSFGCDGRGGSFRERLELGEAFFEQTTAHLVAIHEQAHHLRHVGLPALH